MKQKRLCWFCLAAGIILSCFTLNCEGEKETAPESMSESLSVALDNAMGGNGAHHGKHYTLNIIGSKFVKKPDLHNKGRRIFPPLSGSAKIVLSQGEFEVLDGNGTDDPAKFQLPHPEPKNDGVAAYQVWARTMATPVGRSTTTTCATSVATGEELCSDVFLELTRENGKPVFSNVSDKLLYLVVDADKDGVVEQYPLFDEAFTDYYWLYDNEELKHAQLRFDNGSDDDDDDDDNDDTDEEDDDDDTDDDEIDVE